MENGEWRIHVEILADFFDIKAENGHNTAAYTV